MAATSTVFIRAISIVSLCLSHSSAFSSHTIQRHAAKQKQISLFSTEVDVPPSVESAAQKIEDCKNDLVRMCDSHDLGNDHSSGIEGKVRKLEGLGLEVCYNISC